jgi:quercetin dioxygenase-like cupin family protein
MEKQVWSEIERFSPEKHVHVPVFVGERTKVLLLCLGPGLSVPPHSHPGFEITLQPLRGRAVMQVPDGAEVELKPGEIYFADGALSFHPRNPFGEEFEMLIHLVKK